MTTSKPAIPAAAPAPRGSSRLGIGRSGDGTEIGGIGGIETTRSGDVEHTEYIDVRLKLH